MTMVEGVAEMILAERPFMRPQGPSSAMSCRKVRMMELLPSTCERQCGRGHGLPSAWESEPAQGSWGALVPYCPGWFCSPLTDTIP